MLHASARGSGRSAYCRARPVPIQYVLCENVKTPFATSDGKGTCAHDVDEINIFDNALYYTYIRDHIKRLTLTLNLTRTFARKPDSLENNP